MPPHPECASVVLHPHTAPATQDAGPLSPPAPPRFPRAIRPSRSIAIADLPAPKLPASTSAWPVAAVDRAVAAGVARVVAAAVARLVVPVVAARASAWVVVLAFTAVTPRIAVWVGFRAAPAEVRPPNLLPLLVAGCRARTRISGWEGTPGSPKSESSIFFNRRSSHFRRLSHFRLLFSIAAAIDSTWLPGACWSWGGSWLAHSTSAEPVGMRPLAWLKAFEAATPTRRRCPS